MNRALAEKIVELDRHLISLVTEADVDAHERLISRVESESEADVALQLSSGSDPTCSCRPCRVAEYRHVEAAEDLPAILGVQEEQVVATEPERSVSAKIIGAAEHRLHVEGNGFVPSFVNVVTDFARSAITRRLVEERNVLLRFQIEPPEVAPPESAVTEVVKLRDVVAAAARSSREVAVVVLHESHQAEEVRLLLDSGNAIDPLRGDEAGVGAGADVVKDVSGRSARAKLWQELYGDSPVDRRIFVAVIAASLRDGIRP